MTDLVQLNYDEMQNIIKLFESDKDEIQQLHHQTRQMVESLHGSQWIGEAADRFFGEMQGEVFVRTEKMIYVLDVAAGVAKQIVQIVHQADEDTKGLFASIGA
jgi:WXG100 family type VII secretion target